MSIRRSWEVQVLPHSWPLQLGFHIDHTDPSITLHLPWVIFSAGRLKQPGFRRGEQVASDLDDQMVEAIYQQRAHAQASNAIDRSGWTRQQWIDDARQQFGDLHGSVVDLLNGHISALLAEIDAVERRIAQARAETAEQIAQELVAMAQAEACSCPDCECDKQVQRARSSMLLEAADMARQHAGKVGSDDE